MNKQRDAFYRLRRAILEAQGNAAAIRTQATNVLAETLAGTIHAAAILPPEEGEEVPLERRVRAAVERYQNLTDAEWKRIEETLPADLQSGVPDETKERVNELCLQHYDARARSAPPSVFDEVVRTLLLRALDTLWTDHLETMEYLRTGIGLRGYGQRDPLVEYRRESHQLFQNLLANFRQEAAAAIFHLTIHAEAPRREPDAVPRERLILSHPTSPAPTGVVGQEIDEVSPHGVQSRVVPSNVSPPTGGSAQAGASGAVQPVRAKAPVGRNDPCPCGSGKKYKKCHGR